MVTLSLSAFPWALLGTHRPIGSILVPYEDTSPIWVPRGHAGRVSCCVWVSNLGAYKRLGN